MLMVKQEYRDAFRIEDLAAFPHHQTEKIIQLEPAGKGVTKLVNQSMR